MATSKQLHLLATRPGAHARFVQTGQLPQGVAPKSPLIDLLRALSPRDLGAIRGLRVDASLGYGGSRQFQTAAQALRWLAPDDEVFGAFPAESWRLKNFSRKLTLADLARNCPELPAGLADRNPRLA